MLLEEELQSHAPDRPTVCTLGVFDGVHRGHLALLERTRLVAHARGMRSAALVFHPHPRSVLAPNSPSVPTLTPLVKRGALIAAQGVDIVAPITFTRELSQLSAREFSGALQVHLRMAGLVVGPDFALGRNREGTVPVLRALGAELGFSVNALEPLVVDGTPVSSTSVRQALAGGDIGRVTALLNRRYCTEGRVAHGDGRGRTLGYPTANLAPSDEWALPADGIYATLAHLEQGVYDSATYVGTRPTFGGVGRVVEVFLLDFEGDLYGQRVGVEWVARVREDRTFSSADQLQEQMERDIVAARVALGSP